MNRSIRRQPLAENRNHTDPIYDSKPMRDVRHKYVIIKELSRGRDGVVFCGVAKINLASARNLEYVRESLVAIKIPQSTEEYVTFIAEADLMATELPSRRSCTQIVSCGGTVLHCPGLEVAPWIATRYIRGGTIYRYLTTRGDGFRPHPAFVWHVLAQLLDASLELRGDFEANNPDFVPVLHNDIHLGNVMIDPTDHAPREYGPLPNIKLIDFGRAKVGPANPRDTESERALSFHRHRSHDLRQIGKVFHSLCHSRVRNGRLFHGTNYTLEGECACRWDEPQLRVGEFTSQDHLCHYIMKLLLGPYARRLSGPEIRRMSDVAKSRRRDAHVRWGSSASGAREEVQSVQLNGLGHGHAFMMY